MNPGLHWFCFTTALCGVLEISRRLLNQSDTKLKYVTFPRLKSFNVFTLSSHWLLVIFTIVLIGRFDYFGFGFTTLKLKSALSHMSPVAPVQIVVPEPPTAGEFLP